MPHVAKVLASAANYMICDDHEFTDDLGDEPEHSNPSTIHFYVATLAYQVYNEYQHQLLADVDGEEEGGVQWMSWRVGGGCTCDRPSMFVVVSKGMVWFTSDLAHLSNHVKPFRITTQDFCAPGF